MQGKRYIDIARSMDVTEQCVRNWRNDPTYQAYLESLKRDANEEVRNVIVGEMVSSANTIVALRNGAQSEKVKLASAQDLLDRGGLKAVERYEVVHTLTPEMLAKIHAIMGESQLVDTIDVEYTSVLPERAE